MSWRVLSWSCQEAKTSAVSAGYFRDIRKFWKKYTYEKSNLLLKKLWTETKTSWEQVLFNGAHLSGGNVEMNHASVPLK